MPVLVGVPRLSRPVVASIGSDPEIGVQFTRWGAMGEQARSAWFRHIVAHWGGDLCGGYATVCWPQRPDTGQETK